MLGYADSKVIVSLLEPINLGSNFLEVRREGVALELVLERVSGQRVLDLSAVPDAKWLYPGGYQSFNKVVNGDVGIRAKQYRLRDFKMHLETDLRMCLHEHETRRRTLSSFTASMIVFVLPVPGG